MRSRLSTLRDLTALVVLSLAVGATIGYDLGRPKTLPRLEPDPKPFTFDTPQWVPATPDPNEVVCDHPTFTGRADVAYATSALCWFKGKPVVVTILD